MFGYASQWFVLFDMSHQHVQGSYPLQQNSILLLYLLLAKQVVVFLTGANLHSLRAFVAPDAESVLNQW